MGLNGYFCLETKIVFETNNLPRDKTLFDPIINLTLFDGSQPFPCRTRKWYTVCMSADTETVYHLHVKETPKLAPNLRILKVKFELPFRICQNCVLLAPIWAFP